MWKPTKDWKVARHGTSGAIEVEKLLPDGKTKQYGHAKPNGVRDEYLASLLARAAGISVPVNEIDTVDGHPGLYAISHAHGKESIDISRMEKEAPEALKSEEAKKALRKASRLVAFYAWTRTGDFKNDHIVMDPKPDGSYEAAGVDFQNAFGWGEADGGKIETSGMPQCLASNLDKTAVAEGLAGIEAMTDEQIRDMVSSLPENVASDIDKKRLSDGLIGRRDKLREAMQKQGRIP
jgi:hypothetical protein